MPEFEDELNDVLPNDCWNNLCSYNNKFIGVHTINVLYQTVRDPIYLNEFNDYEKNIMKWSALLHDICKRSLPLFHGKDHIHPFVSGMAVLEIFKHFRFIGLEGEEEKDAFTELIELIGDAR